MRRNVVKVASAGPQDVTTILRTGRAGRAFNSGQQFHPPCPAAASIVAHALELHVALREVRLGEHAVLSAPIAPDPQQPRRERGERFVHRLGAGRKRIGAV
jgi:hypothetical protein